MNGYNRVVLVGTVGQDAEVKALEGGNSVATVSLAINDSYTDKNTGERKTKTEWVRVEAWKGLATFLGTYGKKGTGFLVEGRIKTDSWEQDGQTKYSTKVVAEQILFTSSKGPGESTNAAPAQAQNNAPAQAQNNAPVQEQNSAPAQTQNNAPAQAVSSGEFIGGMQNGNDDDLPF